MINTLKRYELKLEAVNDGKTPPNVIDHMAIMQISDSGEWGKADDATREIERQTMRCA